MKPPSPLNHNLAEPADRVLFTLGHSTRTAEEVLTVLRAHGISEVADVRRFPGSRRYPHFERASLEAFLGQAGLGYRWWPELGGRRRPRPDSRNAVWRNDGFRGYADYMETPAFQTAADALFQRAAGRRVVVMCAEAVWWRCHRSLLADYAKAHGWTVEHIVSTAKTEPHPFTAPAQVENGRLVYRAGAPPRVRRRKKAVEPAGDLLFDLPPAGKRAR